MDLERIKEKLSNYKKSNIVFTRHAEIRALGRGIDLEEVKNNIVNPSKLVFCRELGGVNEFEMKYECYFNYSKNHSHKYILTTNGNIIIVTIISINRDWQRVVK